MRVRPTEIGPFVAGGVRDTPPASLAARDSAVRRPATAAPATIAGDPHRRRAAALVLGLIAALAAARRRASPIRSATSRSTTTPGSGSSPTGSCSTSSSTRRRSRPSRHASTFDTDGDGERLRRRDRRRPRRRVRRRSRRRLTLSRGRDAARRSTLTDAGLTFPPGVGGLSTMRIGVRASRDRCRPAIDGGLDVFAFEDRSFPDRIGWREIVVVGSGRHARRGRGTSSAPTASRTG